jgi:cytochrome b6-f complex subunit 4
LKISEDANPFATPNEILPEWYLFPTFNFLRILSNKFMGILSMFYLPGVLLIIPFGENLNRYSNPFRRALGQSIFLIIFITCIWLSIGGLPPIIKG